MNADRTARAGPMLPGKAADPGVTAADSRQFPGAALRRIRTGSPRRGLPERFGKWNSVFRRSRRRQTAGFDIPVRRVVSDSPQPEPSSRMMAARKTCFARECGPVLILSRRSRPSAPGTIRALPLLVVGSSPHSKPRGFRRARQIIIRG